MWDEFLIYGFYNGKYMFDLLVVVSLALLMSSAVYYKDLEDAKRRSMR